MANVAIIEGFDGPAVPSTYQLPPGQVLEVLAVRADFDGSGSAGAYVPQVSFYAQDGRKLGSFPSPTTVAMGASAGCTFFPTAPPSSGGGGGSGIQYDTANSGDWLEIATTSTTHLPSVAFTTAGEFSVEDTSGAGSAISLTTRNGGNINLDCDSTGQVSIGADELVCSGTREVDLEPTDLAIVATSAGGLTSDTGTNTLSLHGGGSSAVKISCDTVFGTFGIQVGGSTAQRVGFFGAAPVTQPATPVTLADVIATLQGLGLCA